MDAASLDMSLTRGEDYDRTLTVAVDGVPINLTGYAARLHIRSTPKDTGTLLLSMSSDGVSPAARLVLGGTAGTIRRIIPAAVSETLAAGTGYYDLLLISGSALQSYLVRGAFTVHNRITT